MNRVLDADWDWGLGIRNRFLRENEKASATTRVYDVRNFQFESTTTLVPLRFFPHLIKMKLTHCYCVCLLDN